MVFNFDFFLVFYTILNHLQHWPSENKEGSLVGWKVLREIWISWSIFSFCFSVCLYVSLSLCISVCLTICVSVCLPLSVSLSVSLYLCLSVSLSLLIFVCRSVFLMYVFLCLCLFVCMPLSLFLSVTLLIKCKEKDESEIVNIKDFWYFTANL